MASVMGGRRIRRKLWVVLALPLVVILAMAGLWGLVLFRDYQATAAVADRVDTDLAADGLVLALQRERGLSDGLLRGERAFRPTLTTERLRVDEARGRFTELADRAEEVDRPTLRAALDQLAQLDGLRAQVDALPADRGPILAGYADLASSVRRATAGLTHERLDDEQLLSSLTAMRTLGVAAEAMTVEAGHLAGVAVIGSFRGAEYSQFVEHRAARLAALAEFERHATPSQLARVSGTVSSSVGGRVWEFERTAWHGSGAAALGIRATSWWTAAATLADDLRSAQEDIRDSVRARGQYLREESVRRLGALGGFVLLAALVGAGAVLAAARALSRPLARLADEADEVARKRLPEAAARLRGGAADQDEPPELPSVAAAVARGGPEITRVAGAIDNLQHTALSLAAEQAALRRRAAESWPTSAAATKTSSAGSCG